MVWAQYYPEEGTIVHGRFEGEKLEIPSCAIPFGKIELESDSPITPLNARMELIVTRVEREGENISKVVVRFRKYLDEKDID